ncbi:hypothetical protein EXN66_Car008117 [Channa argus]|uniref:Uncharacterized protein n=1 Tax=Channa argus TaxID=215402 RepID=A0A6G1PQ17_CHAAH|nr:hypothetical protein EXN66_Car008117 [Channa argus]
MQSSNLLEVLLLCKAVPHIPVFLQTSRTYCSKTKPTDQIVVLHTELLHQILQS